MLNIRKFLTGLRILPVTSTGIDSKGEIEVLDTGGKANYHNGTTASPFVTEDHSATLTNKSIDADSNTITNIENADIKAAAGIVFSKLENLTSGNILVGSAGNVPTQVSMSGEASIVASGAITLDNASVIAKVLTGFTSGAGSISSSDSLLSAIQKLDGNDGLKVSKSGDTMTGDLVIDNAKEVRFSELDSNGSNYIGLKAPDSVTANKTFSLPDGDGSANQVLKTDGSANLGWITPYTDPLTTNGDLLVRAGGVTTRLPIGTDGQVLKVASGAVAWGTDATGGGGGGSGSSVGDQLGNLSDAELSQVVVDVPDRILDSFTTDKGTKSNTAISASSLVLSGTNLTGTYERTKNTTPTTSSISGALVADIQQLAPKNTAMSPSSTSTSVSVYFQGDVTTFFPASNDIIIGNKTTSDGVTNISFLTNSGDVVARLSITSSSYDSGTDTTTVVVSNGSALDLSMGVSSSIFNTQLRFFPFDYAFEGKSKTAGSYEAMDVDNAYARQEISIPGENFFTELGTITGSIIKQDGSMSPSRQYGLVRLLEKNAADATFHWFYSATYGASWTKFTTTKLANSALVEEDDGSSLHFRFLSSHQLVVADNGKCFSTWRYLDGSAVAHRGVYADLSASPTTLTDCAAPGGTDASNDVNSAGYIFDKATIQTSAYVAADLVDLSFIAVLGIQNNATTFVRQYSNGGATHIGLSTSTISSSGGIAQQIFVTGSGSSHSVAALITRGSDGFLFLSRIDQGSLSFVAETSISGINGRLLGATLQSNRMYIALVDTSAFDLYYINVTNVGFGLTPSSTAAATTVPSAAGLTIDIDNGWSAAAIFNLSKYVQTRAIQNPADEKHVVMALDLQHPDGNERSTYIEIPDVSANVPVGISQFTTDSNAGLRDITGRTQRGQTITAVANTPKLRTQAFLLYQIGVIPAGYTIQCDLYATSAGVPTGASLGTSQTIDPSKITKSTSGEYVFFNFGNITLSNGTVYALVLSGTYPISASNYITIKANSTSVYAGGSGVSYDGATWTAGSIDCVFITSSIYYTTIGKCLQAGANLASYGFRDQDSQIAKIDSTTAQIIFRRALTGGTQLLQMSGHPWRRVMTWGTGGTQSTLSSAQIAGYASSNFDENLIFASAYGSVDCQGQNISTGVLDANSPYEDRSGACIVVSGANNIASADIVTDASFQAGVALDLDGSSEYVVYSDRAEFDLYFNKPFCIEAEVNIASLASAGSIVAQYDSVTTFGWNMNYQTDGSFAISIFNTSGTTIAAARSSASVLTTGTYYALRVTYDGLGGAPKLWKATSYNGTFTETSYQSSTAFVSGNTASTDTLSIGRLSNGSQYFNGKRGYTKIANGSASFAYQGYKNQAPLVGALNLGTRILAENKVGTNSLTSGTNFDNAGIITGNASQASVVDSNRIVLLFNHSIGAGNQGKVASFKLTMNRDSIRNVSSFQGLVLDYSK